MRAAFAVSMALGLASSATTAVARPVPWSRADRHVGEIVVVEGVVREVAREGQRLTLLFDPDDPKALCVTLLIPLITDLPPAPELLYRERRVLVHGRITRAAGHLDLIVTDPGRIVVAGLTSDTRPPEAPPPTAATPPATPPRAGAAPSRPSPRADAAARAAAACRRLRASHDAARRDALAAVDALRSCIGSGGFGCAAATDAVAAPMTRLEWIAQQLRTRCPADPGSQRPE